MMKKVYLKHDNLKASIENLYGGLKNTFILDFQSIKSCVK